MGNKTVMNIKTVIDYTEANLGGKPDPGMVAETVHCSEYHLYRMFTNTVGMTIHDYVWRRQLTETVKFLVLLDRPIIEVTFICDYESRWAFFSAFKSIYRVSPAKCRDNREFHLLQLRFALHGNAANKVFAEDDICSVERADISAWMNLIWPVIDGYPIMNGVDYLNAITKSINKKRALALKDGDISVGVMALSDYSGCIDFLGINPQYYKQGIQELFLDTLMEIYLPGQKISMTAYREGDKADTGRRDVLKQLGFAGRELLIEFSYPTQRLVFPPKYMEDI